MKHLIKLLCGSTLCLFFGCMQQDQQMKNQLEDNIKIAKDSWGGFTQHDASKMAPYFADNVILVDYGSPKPDTGWAQFQQTYQAYVTAFPDGKPSFEGDVAHGDMVVLQWRVVGTNTGPLMNMPATNKSVDTHGCTVYHLVNGKIVHLWQYWDRAGFMRQLGMMPEPGQPVGKEKKK